jgi:site-specific recombinase XerD
VTELIEGLNAFPSDRLVGRPALANPQLPDASIYTLSDLADDPDQPPDLEATPAVARRRGRPTGWRMPTFATLNDLTLEDFSFLRGVNSGMTPVWAFEQFYANVHFDRLGRPDPESRPHGLEINALARNLEARVLQAARGSVIKDVAVAAKALAEPSVAADVSEAAKVETHMAFTEWFGSLPEDFYGEDELEDRYREYLEDQGVEAQGEDSNGDIGHDAQLEVLSASQQMKRKIAAINALQTYLAMRPTPAALTNFWLAPKVCDALAVHRVSTLGDLMRWIGIEGRHWHKKIHWFGAYRAKRLQAWLKDHEATLGPLLTVGPQWKPKPPLKASIAPLCPVSDTLELVYDQRTGMSVPSPTQLVRRFGTAPLELLTFPAELDGSTGPFRPLTPNAFNANNDYQAVQIWLGSFLSAGKQRTFESYRREVERFYVWCLMEAKVPLSGVSLQQATAYQMFLQNIPEKYITTKVLNRTDPAWRPFKGQLNARSQSYALQVIRSLYKALMDGGYMSINPFAALKSSALGAKRQAMDTTRTLHEEDLVLVAKALAALPGLRSTSLAQQAFARRTQLLLHLALTTGMRLAEISAGNLLSLRHPRVDDKEAEDWMIDVMGKGSKVREMPLQSEVLDLIKAHHADWKALLETASEGVKGEALATAIPDAADGALPSPSDILVRLQQFERCPPLVAALYAPVGSEARCIDGDSVMANDNSALSRSGIYKTLKGFFKQAAKQAETPERAVRFTQVSTHWLRHTFAHEVLRANNGDDGLIMAQLLLGHASINTTAEYLKEDQSKKVKAARKVRPLGKIE